MTKTTTLDSITFSADGTAQIRILKQTLDDKGNVIETKYHRTSVPPGQDVDEQLQAVSVHLSGMGYGEVKSPDVSEIKSRCAVVHTEEVIAAAQEKLAR